MKNRIIRIISAVMAASVLLAAYGCKDGKKAVKQEVNMPDIKDSVARVDFTSVDQNGKEVNATTFYDVPAPDLNKAVLGLSAKETFEKEGAKENFKKNLDDYGIDDKQYEEIVNKQEDWQSYSYMFYIANSTPRRIAFRSVSHTDKDGIIINNDLGCEYGVPSGRGSTIYIEGMVDKSKYADEAAIKKALSEMNVKLNYTYVENMDDTVDDWSKVDIKTMDIDFTK